jgi:phenol/toluene 2-monooxygenase (NADH) P4/A4
MNSYSVPATGMSPPDQTLRALPDETHRFASPLLNIAWDDHLMFCAPFCLPVASYLSFAEFVSVLLPQLYGEHPDFSHIDWSRAQWQKNDEFWIPKADKSLWDNGVRHKDWVRLRTPGLTGLNSSSS